MIIIQKIRNYLSKNKLFFITICITLIIEIFICNFGFFRTLLYGNNNIVADYDFTNNLITISNINCRVSSINFEYDNLLTDKVTYNLSYIANDNSAKIDIMPKVILQDEMQYINFDTHTNCEKIEVHILTESNLNIKNITLNHPNISINILRIGFIYIICNFFLKINQDKLSNVSYDINDKKQNKSLRFNVISFSIFILIYIILQFNSDFVTFYIDDSQNYRYQLDFSSFLIDKDEIDKEDSILMQTEALINGQVELMVEPSEELKNMENPYDSTKRDDEGVQYLYDVAYYNGKYYNYFGIAPILTSILPFRLLTGKYTHTYIFNMIYIFISIFSLYSLYKKFINRYIEKISVTNFNMGFFALLMASNILTLMRGAKYDIVVSCGIASILLSLNIILSLINSSKYKYIKLILLGITSALIVLSKPNLIIYYILILMFIYIYINKQKLKDKIIDISFILVPIGILAIFQMIINYLRFDNIFEFGAKYQLTGFNMTTCMSFTFGKIYAGIVEYLFKTPVINPLKFPFVFINKDTALTIINEVCYENRLVGLISIPIFYVYIFKKNILDKSKDKELKKFIDMCIVISLLSIIINSCCGGICEAYSIDFKMILSLGAILLLLKGISNNSTNPTYQKVFVILCFATICIMLPIGLTTECDLLTNCGSDITVFFKSIFEFWT